MAYSKAFLLIKCDGHEPHGRAPHGRGAGCDCDFNGGQGHGDYEGAYDGAGGGLDGRMEFVSLMLS